MILNFRKKLNKIRKNDKGNSVILYVGIVLIVCYAITLFLDLLTKTWVFNELQGKLDIATKNTLSSAFNTQALREEMLYITKDGYIDTTSGNKVLSNYQDEVWNKFNTEIQKSYKIGGTLVEVIPQKVAISLENSNRGLGFSKKSRPQLVLHTVLKVRLKASTTYDVINNLSYSLFTADNSGTVDISYSGVTADGKAELIIRTNRRLVYR